MKPQIKLISLMTDNMKSMLKFYKDVIGFTCDNDDGDYIELNHDGVRFALCLKKLAHELSGNDEFKKESAGQRVELAFWLPTKAEVDKTYTEIVEKGAVPICAPHDMPWGQRTAMFADPDGNIHEIYAD